MILLNKTDYWKNLQSDVLHDLRGVFSEYEESLFANCERVLRAFRRCKISEYHFRETSGYGYDDAGREKLDELWAEIFGAESALVRWHFASGTHALSTALFALLHAGDELICATGVPYDTLHGVIGHSKTVRGSLCDRGVQYKEIKMCEDGVDLPLLASEISEKTKVVLLQRSRGYSLRKPLTVSEIGDVVKVIKGKNPRCFCFVDNCYGEFVETTEPLMVGADYMAGSLIKNPGGGIALAGGYVAGSKNIVELVSDNLFAPGIGGKVGASLVSLRAIFQGVFIAPQTVNQALKTAIFAAEVFKRLGYKVFPDVNEKRTDIIQAVELGTSEKMIAFCQALQSFSPVESHVKPVPAAMPGYADEIIMAGGSFVQGSSIELSADGPVRPPYVVYIQGGLVFPHSLQAVMAAARACSTT